GGFAQIRELTIADAGRLEDSASTGLEHGSREGSWKVRIPCANGKGRFGSGSAAGRPHALRNPFLANTPAEAAHIRQHLNRPIRESASTPSRGDRAFARGARLNGHNGRS